MSGALDTFVGAAWVSGIGALCIGEAIDTVATRDVTVFGTVGVRGACFGTL